jgi:nicotinate-nucleotide adenylyltransferase
MKIGILGGTFNPIHNGHLIIAEYIREKLDFDKIIFIPTGIPPHKNKIEVLDGDTRAYMIELSIASNPNFEISTIEIDREDISYTIDTIKKLKEISEDDFHMIIGGDSLLSLHSWKGFEKIISEVNIIVADRYGACGDKIIAEIGRLNEETGKKIISIDTPIIDISSTEIRNKLKMGKSIKYLLPEKVENYILKRGLYSE